MAYVITCGDEGVQINEGTRLGVLGAGFHVDNFSEVVKLLKQLLGEEIAIAASEENDWIKKQLELSSWEQVNASAQQHIEALADKEGLLYAGNLPFTDPKNLQHGIRGHMVRPHNVHIANKICFTLAGGEQTYNLGKFVISAEWVHLAKPALIKSFLQPQIEFYKALNGGEIILTIEEDGILGEEIAQKNKAALLKAGIITA
ncbi:MAG: hypothetical protein M3Q81_02540 [bacterium]|nr:hypothetical protein [bacterium]